MNLEINVITTINSNSLFTLQEQGGSCALSFIVESVLAKDIMAAICIARRDNRNRLGGEKKWRVEIQTVRLGRIKASIILIWSGVCVYIYIYF